MSSSSSFRLYTSSETARYDIVFDMGHPPLGPFDLGSDERLRALGMDRNVLEQFLRELDEQLEGGRECNHSARHALAWLKARGLDADAIYDVFKESGGFCDCELVLNVDPESIFGDHLSPDEMRQQGLARAAQRKKVPPPPKLETFDDGVLRFSVPKKPWRLRAPSDGEVLRCTFGSKPDSPELRLLTPPAGGRERFCLARAIGILAKRWLFYHEPSEAREIAEGEWTTRKYAIARQPFEIGASAGTMYKASSPSYLPMVVWWWFDRLPARVLEFRTESSRARNDILEVQKIISTIQFQAF